MKYPYFSPNSVDILRIASSILLIGLYIPLQADTQMHRWEEAGKDPDRLVLTWPGDPATSIAVSWRTNRWVNEAFAEITLSIPEPRFDFNVRRVEAETEFVELFLESHNLQNAVHYHSTVFEGLQPDTKYLYRVGDGEEHWSEWVEFRTASRKPEPFSFVYFGDAQNFVLSHWSRVIRAAYSKAPSASFFLHAGDLINNAHFDEQWGEWFKAGGWIHASVPNVVVTGNHEYRYLDNAESPENVLSILWRPQFNLPTYDTLPTTLRETAYFHDYQGVRLIVLNTNVMPEHQVYWLDQRLEENRNDWAIVSFHHPIFSSGQNRDNKVIRDLWKPILDKYAVDLVLQGHDHTYARGHVPVSLHEKSDDSQVQTMYVNSVSGGKMYEFMETDWDVYAPEGIILDRRAENGQFFQVLSVDGKRLTYKAYTANGLLYDAFRLDKNDQGQKSLSLLPIDVETEYRFSNTSPYRRNTP